MNCVNFHLTIDYVGSSGIVLTPEQKAALQTSLTILKSEQKFFKVNFWGSIKGNKGDYYIAQGIGKDEMHDKRTIYGKDCMNWNILPAYTEEHKKLSKFFKERFTGDPSNEFEYINYIEKTDDKGETIEEEEILRLKEEDRLSVLVDEIDKEVFIVPRGAYVRLPTGQIVSNRLYEGLPAIDSLKLSSYLHFRQPYALPLKTLMERARFDKAIDFLDPIEEDIPKISWSLQLDRGTGLVILKSLVWPGYVFYQIPEHKAFGSVYFGYGERNIDLPFMI